MCKRILEIKENDNQVKPQTKESRKEKKWKSKIKRKDCPKSK